MTMLHTIKKTDAQRKADVLSELENVLFDASQIQVEADGNKVTLRGNVRNFSELAQAQQVAWAAPDVFMVEDWLEIGRFFDNK